MVKAARSPAAPKSAAAAASETGASTKSVASKRKSAAAAKPSVTKATAPRSTARGAAKTRSERASSPARKPRATAKTTTSPAPKRAAASAGKPAAKATTRPAGKPTAGIQCAPINLGFLSGFVGFHLRLAQDASYRAFARFKDKELVKPGRFPALAIIHLNPGISQSALGRAIARDKSTVSPLIKDLQKNGLISRKPSANDRRSVTLVLTKKGERVLDRLHARALEHEEDLDKVIGASKSRLVGMLDKITGSLAA